MFICQMCHTPVPPKTRCHKIVAQTRTKQYPVRRKAHPGYYEVNGQMRRSGRFSDRRDDSGGTGLETAKELSVCPKCAQEWLAS